MSKRNDLFVFVSVLAFTASLALGGSSAARADITARDLRTETRTHWDYQPGQGPRHQTTDRDFFRPTTPLPEEPLTPPPPLESGDWHNPPRAEDMVPVRSDVRTPRTETSMEVGAQVSNYHYSEPGSPQMTLDGPHGGIVAQATGVIGDQWFLRGDGRFVAGSPEYKGTGHKGSNPNYIAEARATLGRDFLWRRFAVSPYVGIGYRYAYNDLRGNTTSGAVGYRRDNNLLFVPIGVQPSMRFFNGDRLTMTAEFDPVIHGWQRSRLSDMDVNEPDIINHQKGGFGVRSDLMYKTAGWSFGPFVNYWDIDKSTNDCGSGLGPVPITRCGVEPQNHTVEYGLQFRYRFYQDE